MQGQQRQRVLRDVREQASSDPPGARGSGPARSDIAEHDAVRAWNATRQECLRFAVSRQGRSRQRARAADRRDVRAGKVSGGPRAGCAVRKVGVVCMPPLSRRHAGWRNPRAGPSVAGWCPHPTGGGVPLPRCPDTGGSKRRVAFSDTGLALRFRSGSARALDSTSRRPSRIRKTARHRPVSTPAPAAGRRWPAQGTGISPVAGQAPAREGRDTCQLSNAGAPPPPSSCRTLRQAPGGFPPAWTGTFPGPSGSGSAESVAQGLESVEEMAGRAEQGHENVGRAATVRARICPGGAKRGARLPPALDEAAGFCQKRPGTRLPLSIERGRAVD